ncbi:MAG: heavy metal-binding domain-containing protein [Acidobacteriota bacterium]|nr:heavy metal-binding domain-containing protein [Acidobacteriota bacterium]
MARNTSDEPQETEGAEVGGEAPEHGAVTETEAPYSAGSLEGVPDAGRARLEQNRAGLFTSDLSVNEFLLIKQAGFDPVGLVVGSSIYHIGIQMAGWKRSQELTVLSEAMYGARQLAMTRMEEEADQLGADGVVGVRLDIGRYEWGQDMAEFIAIGTAVRHRDGVLHRAPSGRPFTSDLSGQDFWTLMQTGHRPVGMVMGSCVYHVAHRGMLQSMAQTGRNVELSNYTQALYDARELAMERMQSEAQEIKAEGIVGVQLQEKSHGWGSHTIEFFSIGTGIVPSDGADGQIEAPSTVLDLSG